MDRLTKAQAKALSQMNVKDILNTDYGSAAFQDYLTRGRNPNSLKTYIPYQCVECFDFSQLCSTKKTKDSSTELIKKLKNCHFDTLRKELENAINDDDFGLNATFLTKVQTQCTQELGTVLPTFKEAIIPYQ